MKALLKAKCEEYLQDEIRLIISFNSYRQNFIHHLKTVLEKPRPPPSPPPPSEHNRGFTGFSRFCEGTGLCCVELYLENVLGTLSHFHWLFQHSKEPDWVVKNWSN